MAYRGDLTATRVRGLTIVLSHAAALAVVAVAVFAAPLSDARAQQAGKPDPARGLTVAKRWCAQCHVVSAEQRSAATDAAPPFREFARSPAMTPTRLRAILGDPHGRMPTNVLTRDDISNIIAYIRSLR